MKRIVGWLVSVAALIGLGVLIHAGTPPSPRWRAAADFVNKDVAVRLTADGRVLTLSPHGLESRDAVTRAVRLRGWDGRGPGCVSRSPAVGGWPCAGVPPAPRGGGREQFG